VAFLMAERRPLTARDIKSCVEGYSEMTDEAFARRFYSDRSELLALGVPLRSQRDEFTGEELYTLRSEQYFLPALELSDDELAALQTALFYLEGQFAYAEPLRLALQNLALGRPVLAEPPTQSAVSVNVRGNDYSADMPAWLTKLDAAISKQRTVRFRYLAIGRGELTERTVNPYALFSDGGLWYVVGKDLDRDDLRTFRVSRIQGDITFATRRERDFRAPQDFDPSEFRGRPPWQVGELSGEARIEVGADTAWWVERSFGRRGRLEDGVFHTEYADIRLLASWVLRQDGRARPLDPPALVEEVERSLARIAELHEEEPPVPAAPAASANGGDGLPERPAVPVPPERFAVLQALLAHLLLRCGDGKRATIPATELTEAFRIPYDQLDDHLQLLNLVNFGGGCYAVYSVLEDDVVRVEKELFGDAFRRPPRLTPLEARAIRLALEFVGPMIAAEARTPLDRVRHKLEETFGQFELRETPEAEPATDEEELVRTLADAIRRRRVVEIEYLPVGEETSVRVVEPYSLERELPHWYVHTWDRTREGARSFRFDRMRRARELRETFTPRAGFEPSRLSDARVARVWFSPEGARYRVERGAQELADGAALEEMRVGSPEWLVSEILSFRGEAVVLEPADLRTRVAKRARQLVRELGRKPRARTRR
jgi:proteasome accessory factor C